MIWRECSNKKDFEDDHAVYKDATCNRRQDLNPCQSCVDNVEVAKEKRKLKAQFNKTVGKMLEFTPDEPELCYKESPSFVDIEFNKMENGK